MSDTCTQFGRVPTAVVASGALAELRPSDLAVYIVLCAYAGRGWRVTIGQRRIADLAGVKLGTVSAATKRLRAAGFLAASDWRNGARLTYTIETTPADRSAPTERSTVQRPPNGPKQDRSAPASATVQRPQQNRSAPAEHVQTLQSLSDPSGDGCAAAGERSGCADAREERAELLAALATVCGIDTRALPKSARGALNRAAKELHEVGATPGEIEKRASAYAGRWPNATLTPAALAKHWGTFAGIDDGLTWDWVVPSDEDFGVGTLEGEPWNAT